MTRKRSEYYEQARLLGMSAEREANLMCRLGELLRIAEWLAKDAGVAASRDVFLEWKARNGFK